MQEHLAAQYAAAEKSITGYRPHRCHDPVIDHEALKAKLAQGLHPLRN